jgi:aromatic ring-opening dioxygenase catalytic subunit (LigB family)
LDIVAAFACSHTGLIVTRKDDAPAAQRDAVYGAFATIRDRVKELRPDALLMIAADHQRAFPLAGIPSFSIGVGPRAKGLGDAGLPTCEVEVNQKVGQVVLEGCLQRDIDLAFSEQVEIDHAFAMPLSLITPQWDVPIVPFWQNCNVPPQPTFQRSRTVGKAIADSLGSAGAGRVVVIATGGLSHWVGDEERREFMHRPAGERLAEIGAHPVTLTETGRINQEFDREFLDHATSGRLPQFVEAWSPERVEEAAGNGAQELRTWVMAAAVVGDAPATLLGYEAVSEWLTGCGAIEFGV